MISMEVKPGGKLHVKLLTAIRTRIRQSAATHSSRAEAWKKAEETMVGYIHEKDADALRKNKRDSGEPQYTTIKLPYTYAVVMSAHSYWTTVFLSRSPVLQFQGTTDEGEMQTQALEALIDYQANKGRMMANLFIWLQDVAKYGEGWVSPYWRTDRQRISNIVEEPKMYLGLPIPGETEKKRRIEEVVGYQGNALYNLAPQTVFTDPRYPRNRFQDGEFLGIKTQLSYNQLVEGKARGQYINLDSLKRQKPNGSSGIMYEDSETNSNADALERPTSDLFSTAFDPAASDVYDVYEVYINLIPERWGLGTSTLPEKWVFTVTTDFTAIVECRPMGNMHNKFPLSYLEIDPEGYATFSRGLVEIFSPIQDTLDWLVNTHFFNVRSILNGQYVFDPSRIETRDLLSTNPGKGIRLKPSAYGTDPRQSVHQLITGDVTQAHLSDMQTMFGMGERLGMSDTVMGINHPSSRRSAQEVRGSQTFSVGRLKSQAEYFSATGWQDLGSMLVMNSQQFYDMEKKMKIVGDMGSLAGTQFINVTPEMITGEYGFVPVDGTLPVDRYAQANLWREMIQNISKVPQVAQQYDFGKIFAFVAQLAGLKNINRFKIDTMPDAALASQVQQGNMVPAEMRNIMEPGQVSGMGPTA